MLMMNCKQSLNYQCKSRSALTIKWINKTSLSPSLEGFKVQLNDNFQRKVHRKFTYQVVEFVFIPSQPPQLLAPCHSNTTYTVFIHSFLKNSEMNMNEMNLLPNRRIRILPLPYTTQPSSHSLMVFPTLFLMKCYPKQMLEQFKSSQFAGALF